MSEETKEIVKKETIQESEINIDENAIKSMIYVVRGQQVMLDSDLAGMYQVETKRVNEGVKRNQQRFPETFCFQLSEEEYGNLKSQIATSNTRGGKQKLPYVFTEKGILMLSGLLKNEIAIGI